MTFTPIVCWTSLIANLPYSAFVRCFTMWHTLLMRSKTCWVRSTSFWMTRQCCRPVTGTKTPCFPSWTCRGNGSRHGNGNRRKRKRKVVIYNLSLFILEIRQSQLSHDILMPHHVICFPQAIILWHVIGIDGLQKPMRWGHMSLPHALTVWPPSRDIIE